MVKGSRRTSKSELVDRLHKHPLQTFQLKKAECSAILTIVADIIAQMIIEGREVWMDRLGKFYVKEYKRKIYLTEFFNGNKRELKEIDIKAVKFETTPYVKAKLNKKEIKR